MLKVIRLGSVGYIVTQWQVFLRGQGYLLNANSLFDTPTDVATRSFQKRYKLHPDGVVGNQTFGKAGQLGFELVDASEFEVAYPARPPFLPLSGNEARQEKFGPLAFQAAPTAGNPERIKITNNWKEKNIVEVVIPQLKGVPGYGGKVWFHKSAANQLKKLWQAWEQAGLLPLVLTYEGDFVPRFVRGRAHQQMLSNHAFGTAFDINYAWNKLGAEPATPGQKGCVYQLVPIAHQYGFFWGGHFGRKDGMHFEVAQVQPTPPAG